MVDFNEARISADGKTMIIDVSVKTLYYYDNIYLEEIIIDTQNTFKLYGPSDDPIFRISVPDNTTKSFRIEITTSDIDGISLLDNMFYVYATVQGIPSPDTPCGMDEFTSIHVVFDYGPIYRNIMAMFKEMEKCCAVPLGLIDLILRINALELSLITGHYTQANKYWNKFFSGLRISHSIPGCGCR